MDKYNEFEKLPLKGKAPRDFRSALYALLAEDKSKKITASMVISRCKHSRSAFYQRYENVEDCMTDLMAESLLKLKQDCAECADMNSLITLLEQWMNYIRPVTMYIYSECMFSSNGCAFLHSVSEPIVEVLLRFNKKNQKESIRLCCDALCGLMMTEAVTQLQWEKEDIILLFEMISHLKENDEYAVLWRDDPRGR